MSSNLDHHSDDLFSDTRMSFGDHLEELRSHLIRATVYFVIGLFLSFFVGQYVVEIIAQPVENALQKYYDDRAEALKKEIENDPNSRISVLNVPKQMTLVISRKELQSALGQANPKLLEGAPPLDESAPPIHLNVTLENPAKFVYEMNQILQRFGKRPALKTLSVQEAFMVYFMVCIITGFVISSPFVFVEIWRFVAAGLYPHEKKYVNYYLPFSIFLFLAGVVVCQLFIIPRALEALLAFNWWMNLEPDFRLSEWLSFAVWMPVIVGLCFQTPLVMLFLGKLGIFTPEDFAKRRRIAIFIMLIVAAIVSPSVDPASLMLMWVPMVLLYELGIYLVKWTVPKSEFTEEEVPYQPEEVSTPSGGDGGEGPQD